MTDREAPPHVGFDHPQADPYDDGWFGGEQAAEPMFADDAPTPPHGEPVIHVPEEHFVAPRAPEPAPPPTRRVPTATVNTWTVNGQLRASDTSTLTFRAPPAPWYHAKQARIALVAAAAAVVAVPIVVLVLPDSSSTAPAPPTSVAPQPSKTQPALSSAAPAPINLPPPLPPPPPPPPPPEDAPSAPTYNEPYWTRPAEPSEKPDIGVTRTPVTRAPISVAPQPRQSTGDNSADPGEGRKGFHCGGWC